MSELEKERIHKLNNKNENFSGKYVLYMMQASQRIYYNYALNYAIEKANEYKKPLIVGFSIIPNFPNANTRHYYFMFEGIVELIQEFEKIGITFLIKSGNYEDVTYELAKNAVLVVTDRGYLRYQREIRQKASQKINVKYIEIESDITVPIEIVSKTSIPYARLYRKKLEPYLEKFIKKTKTPQILNKNITKFENSIRTIEDMQKVIKVENLERSKKFVGGYRNAKRLLEEFINIKLKDYDKRNHPGTDYTSNLSPYLHFGNISPVEIAYEVLNAEVSNEIKYSFIDELIVWRELARNFVWYEKDIYDSWKTIPKWAQEELNKHLKDIRTYEYSLGQLENAYTHDEYWNAAQKELVITGKIHNYMRMYWGKKIIEWTKHWKDAYDIIKYLNDKYALDGRDPNGYLNFAWCFGKFDRPFFENPIFGKIRYMNSNGLDRKFDMKLYLKYTKSL